MSSLAWWWIISWVAAGWYALRRISPDLSRHETAVAGTTFGLISGGYITLGWCYLFGYSLTTLIWLNVITTLLVAGMVWRFPLPVSNWSKDPKTNRLAWVIGGGAIFLTWFALTTLTTQNDGYWINNRHNFGDVRLHLAYINSFVEGANVPVTNPIMAGFKPSYPFLIDFITA